MCKSYARAGLKLSCAGEHLKFITRSQMLAVLPASEGSTGYPRASKPLMSKQVQDQRLPGNEANVTEMKVCLLSTLEMNLHSLHAFTHQVGLIKPFVNFAISFNFPRN